MYEIETIIPLALVIGALVLVTQRTVRLRGLILVLVALVLVPVVGGHDLVLVLVLVHSR